MRIERMHAGWWRVVALACAMLVTNLGPAAAADLGSALIEPATLIAMRVGRSNLIDFTEKIVRASVTDPGIATVVILSPTQVLVNGKAAGVTSLVVWDEQEQHQMFNLNVQTDQSQLKTLLQEIAPTEFIGVHSAQDSIVLTGEVVRPTTIKKAQEVAQTFSPNVVNLLHVSEPPQIMLKVRFLEINRTAAQKLGIDLIGSVAGKNGLNSIFFSQTDKAGLSFADTTTGTAQLASDAALAGFFPIFNNSKLRGTVMPNVDARQSRDLFRVLAEPNLMALSGEEASFLAGGELPIPLSTGNNSISVEWKEFGIRLAFTPEVTEAGSIRLKVKPEVSSLDFANAVTIASIRIPALKSRKAETIVELNDGETLIIGGLLNQETVKTAAKVPMVGDLPILGDLFKSDSFQKGETELLVVVNPFVVRPTRAMGTKPLEASPELAPYVTPGQQPWSDSQADRVRRSMDAPDQTLWEPASESDPFLKRHDEWKGRSDAGSADSGYGRALSWSQWNDYREQEMAGGSGRDTDLMKYELAAQDPNYSHVTGMLKERVYGQPTLEPDPIRGYSLYEMFGYRTSSSSW